MLKFFSKTLLKLSGWEIDVIVPKEKKFILIGAPHTSNWDFPLAILVFWTLDLKIYWVGKSQMFRGPLSFIFSALGGIPVDRSSSHGFINQIAEKFQHTESMALAISPEGTRSKTRYWKSGFYYIALAAKTPICLGYIDYRTQKVGFSELLYPTGDIEVDMKIIASFYDDIEGKRVQNQGPIRIKSNN